MDSPSVDNKAERSSSGLATEGLETQLEMFIENLRQINIMVTDFQPQAQPVLNQKFQKIVTDLREIDKLKKVVEDVQIPLEVCDYVDQGQNPQLYTKHCMSATLQKNEEVKGKIEAYRKFKAHLLVESSKFFPEEIERFRAIRTEEEEEDEDEEEDEEVDVEADTEGNVEPDAEVNAEPDVEPDVEVDVEPDVEVDVEPDVEVDVEPDVQVDVEPDVEVDVEPDVEVDMEPDVEVNVEPDVQVDVEADVEVDEEVDVEVDVEEEAEEDATKENGDTRE